MNPSLWICALPIVAAVFSSFAPTESAPRKVAPALVWLQMVVVAIVCHGPLFDASQTLVLTPDLSVDHLSVLFMLPPVSWSQHRLRMPMFIFKTSRKALQRRTTRAT